MGYTTDLTAYLSQSIGKIIKNAIFAAWQNPRESAFLARFALVQRQAEKQRTASEQQGRHMPPFLIASIASQCNLFCKGCYARANQSCGDQPRERNLSSERWGAIFQEARDQGIAFILLAGGEPLLRRNVLKKAASCPDIIFPVFTNGTLVDDFYIQLFNRHRNLLPILSLEGPEAITDARRGEGAFRTVMAVMDRLQAGGIFYGASITVTKDNLEAVTGDEFVRDLYARGCRVLIFVEYVPVTPETEALAPGDPERQLLEIRQDALREAFAGMILISFPGDEKYTGGCLAAGRGFFHINAQGGAEPCPFSPFSDISLRDHSLLEALESPLFRRLGQEGLLLGEHPGGCQLFAHETEVRSFLEK